VILNHGRIEQEGSPDAVYQAPANAFVYHFLGNLNLFHARIENGDTFLGAPAPVSSLAPTGNSSPMVYVRPHLMHVDRHAASPNHLPGRIRHINAAGPLVKLEIASDQGLPVQVEMSHGRFRELGLAKDDLVFYIPIEMKVF
jgi:sulfate transport system ATP-binding protein